MKSNCIGILGGAFDPVHLDHIAMGKHILEKKICQKVLYVPSPPRADKTPQVSAEHRLNMLKIACSANPHTLVSDIELRQGYQGTYLLLKKLAQENGIANLKLIIGADTYPHIKNWIQGEKLLGEFALIIFPRKNYPLPSPTKHLSKGFKSIELLKDFEGKHASSKIRDKLWHCAEARRTLATGVWEYIYTHRLYKT
ncbi:MAG: nicotinate (nicotinamide) nucleotide adenylyltransferase [Fibrobacter sp.]|nr:nicotinate (nicotinamide) nucleotide adenylyltransferase [Fibrobacter sp.]